MKAIIRKRSVAVVIPDDEKAEVTRQCVMYKLADAAATLGVNADFELKFDAYESSSVSDEREVRDMLARDEEVRRLREVLERIMKILRATYGTNGERVACPVFGTDCSSNCTEDERERARSTNPADCMACRIFYAFRDLVI